MFVGDQGSGKSYAMLATACELDPEFTIDGNLFLRAGALMSHIGEFYKGGRIGQIGKIWIYDECGIDLNSKKHMDAINKGFNAFFQTMRHRRYIFLGSVPKLKYLSKGVREQMHIRITADSWDGDRYTTKILPREMQYNEDKDMSYIKRYVVKIGKKDYPLNTVHIPKPPQHIIDEYEIMKSEFTDSVMKEVNEEIRFFEQRKLKERVSELGSNPEMSSL